MEGLQQCLANDSRESQWSVIFPTESILGSVVSSLTAVPCQSSSARWNLHSLIATLCRRFQMFSVEGQEQSNTYQSPSLCLQGKQDENATQCSSCAGTGKAPAMGQIIMDTQHLRPAMKPRGPVSDRNQDLGTEIHLADKA